LFRSRLFLDLQFGGVDLPQDRLGARQERLAQLGQPDRSAQAIEQLRAKFILELADLLRQRRLCQVFLWRGAGKASRPGDGARISELKNTFGMQPSRQGLCCLLYATRVTA
jgi:hypothetical protein